MRWLTVLISCLPLTTGAECKPEPLPLEGEVVRVRETNELMDALARANREGHLSIVLEDGTYELAGPLVVKGDAITVRGASGERDRVVIRGAGMDLGPSHVFAVSGDDFTLADVTIGWVANHAVQVRGEADADGALFHDVRFVDAKEQLFKVSYDQNQPTATADKGRIEWCQFDFTAGHTYQAYAGGISAIGARDWEVRNSRFLDIRSPERTPTGPAILFWGGSSGTRISGNVIASSDRGIQVGLGDRGHVGGLVMNNMVHTVTDVGIGLENARGARVYNNSVFSENYRNSIEYRFEESRGVLIENNVVSGRIKRRDGGEASLEHNVLGAPAAWFRDVGRGDLRLDSPVSDLVDQGRRLAEVINDIDCERRPLGHGVDIGADELARITDPTTND